MASVHQPKYGTVINGIPTASVNPIQLQDPELATQLQHQNKGSGLQTMEMKTLPKITRQFLHVTVCH